MITRRRHNKNSNENLVFSSGTHKSRAWTEFARASVQISNKTLVSGKFGTTKIVKGNLTFSLGNIQRECSVKMLKGKVLVSCKMALHSYIEHLFKGTEENYISMPTISMPTINGQISKLYNFVLYSFSPFHR
jgi:hypothetical protein